MALVLMSQLPMLHLVLLAAVEQRTAAVAGFSSWATAELTLHCSGNYSLTCWSSGAVTAKHSVSISEQSKCLRKAAELAIETIACDHAARNAFYRLHPVCALLKR